MRRYISILIMAISIAVTSCNNLLVKESATQEEKAFVTLAVGSPSSRTILPESYDEVASLVNFTFTATSTAGEEVTKTFTDYDTLQTARIPIASGTYDCKLSATSTGGIKYEGVLEDKVIAPGDNTLAFKLQAVQLSTTPGSLEVQLTFPRENVQMVKAGLYSIAGEALDGFPEEVLEITSGNTVTYNKDEVPGGSHLVQFSFYGDDEGTLFLGMHTEVIVIVSGKKSADIRSIDSLNPVYTITYELNEGTFIEGYSKPDKFSPHTEIQLPSMFEVSKDNYRFVGWYEDADCSGAPVDTILRGTGENKTFYAKWALSKIVTASTVETLDLSSTSGEYWVIVTGEITSSTISTLKSKLTAAGESAKIHLDLSQTTGLTSIVKDAFSGCSGLTSVEIPLSVTSIGSSAFYGCSGLTSVTFGEGSRLKGIGSSAFSGCSGLTSVEIPSSVTSIGSYAFRGCSGLTSVYYQGDLAYWCKGFGSADSYLMKYCRNLYINGELVQGNLVIPASVTSIGDCAFMGYRGLTRVEIPSSVTSIGDSAFYACSGLTSVTFGEGSRLKGIGDSAFSDCSGLTSVEIPSSVTSIGDSAFYACSGLTSVRIPSSVISIGWYVFSHCSGLTSVEIPSSVTSIGSSAFKGCSGLTSVEIPAGVTSIGDCAFYECSGLTSVEIPSSVTSIGQCAFYGCSGLTSVTFGDISGWYVTDDLTAWMNKTDGSAVTLSATDLAANEKLVTNTYIMYCWYKKKW